MWSKSIGVNEAIKALAKYYDVKYNDFARYKLLRRYANGVQIGWISPLAGFDNYERFYNRIQTELVGAKTSNGILITGQTEHFMQRVLGTMVDPDKLKHEQKIIRRSGVDIDDLIHAVLHGTAQTVTTDKKTGKRSQVFRSAQCAVSVNPDTGVLIQCNPQ